MSDEVQPARVFSPGLEGEAKRLARVWTALGCSHLDSYLVQEAENPSFNPQSVLVRALVADRLHPGRLSELIEEGFDGFRSVFAERWRAAGEGGAGFSMLELACGSANDYRYLDAHRLARGVNGITTTWRAS